MAVKNKRIKTYRCFTSEQRKSYEALTDKQRLYVDYRGKGYNKSNAYRMAGYDSRNPAQAAYMMEHTNKVIGDLIGILERQGRVESLIEEDSPLNQTINALAEQEGAEQVIQKIEGADSETAKRIQFYRDIISGKIKTVKKIKRYNAKGALIDTRIEEQNDLDVKMRARRELDKILGLNQVIDLDKLQIGGITVNIVDASKKDEVEDERNKINIDPTNIEEISETETEEKEAEASPADTFYEATEQGGDSN